MLKKIWGLWLPMALIISTTTLYGQEASGLSLGQPLLPERKVGEPYIAETHSDWNLRCVLMPDNQERCEAYQMILTNDQQALAELSIFKLPPDEPAAAAATIVVPLETILTEGLVMTIEDREPKRYPFRFCNAIGCYVQLGFTAEELDALKSGLKADMYLSHVTNPNQRINIPISLKGFTKSYNKTTQP